MTEQQKISYALGMNIMGNLAELPIEIDVESVISAIKDVSAEKETALKVEEYHKYMQEFQKKVQEAGQQAVAKAAENNKKAGAEFLAENAKKEGVKVTPSGLQYRVITEGSGAKPSASSKVKVHYTGKLTKGTLLTVEGFFKPEEWTDKDGVKHNRVIMIATKFYPTPAKEEETPAEKPTKKATKKGKK